MSSYLPKIMTFLGGVGLIALAGVLKPDMAHANDILMIGIAMITGSAALHVGQKLGYKAGKKDAHTLS